jgi:hypothetical protein
MMPGFKEQAREIASDPEKWKQAMHQVIYLKLNIPCSFKLYLICHIHSILDKLLCEGS